MTAPLNLGLVCHASFGGSGVIATELGQALAARGHQVHFFCAAAPPRLDARAAHVHLHLVKAPTHAVLPSGEYGLALASKLAEVAKAAHLDVVHAHYGIPHAVSLLLMRQVLGSRRPALVTTLHGTDVLTLGQDPALKPVLAHALAHSDALTAPTKYLKDAAAKAFGLTRDVEVIGNFVDTARFVPAARPSSQPPTLLHNSNFRELKRVGDVVRVLEKVRQTLPQAQLTLVGDGPTRSDVEALVQRLGLEDAVRFTGEQRDVAPYLQESDVFVFPSETESFGLAALEALSCGVPVVATKTGGLPELIEHGVTGFLEPVGDVRAMAARAVELLGDPATWTRFSLAARDAARKHWQPNEKVERYEALYRQVLSRA